MSVISHKRAKELGWMRVDPKPRSKGSAIWLHVTGWALYHCGHPTALHPWALLDPSGAMVCTGAASSHRNGEYGTAWYDLDEPMNWVAAHGDEELPGRRFPPELAPANVRAFQEKIHAALQEYNPQTCITAQELRASGVTVPDHIPGPAWVHRHTVRFGGADVALDNQDPSRMNVQMTVTFTQPFRWVEATVEISGGQS